MGRFGKPDEKDIVDSGMPVEPDPFWPSGVAPSHLPVPMQKDEAIVATFTEVTGPIWHCEKCGRIDQKSLKDDRYCHECYDKEVQNTALAQRVNSNWMEQSKELGLAVFERQPEEGDLEWLIWTKYREYYPLKLPTWTELARVCNTTVATVVKASQRWSFKVRLIAWARFTDDTIQEERIAAIKDMNTKQLAMAKKINDKLAVAIDGLDPQLLKPGEIVNLFKVATELERKITTYVGDKVDSTAVDAKTKQVSTTKPEDLAEVVAILQKTGVLDGKIIGVEQTTRLVAKEDNNE